MVSNIQIISDPQRINVEPYQARGRGIGFVQIQVCTTCSAVVFDPWIHDKWHRSTN